LIIDAHIHVGTWDHADFLGRSCTVAQTLTMLDECGIEGAALLPTDQCDNAGLLREAQQALADGYKGSLWIFAWYRPDRAGQLAWIRENSGHLTGIKIHPSLSRLRPTDEAFLPALDLAEELNLIVLIHCGRWQEIASYRYAIEVAEQRPSLRFLLAHAGGDTPPLATAAADLVAEKGVDNVWFDFSGVREYWVIERNVEKIGAKRYLMGSDYSLAHPRMYLGAVEGMDLPEADKALLLGGNAVELFGKPLE
jgi:predicted TIM-barrel fold metal-dependent hydrolase